MLSVGEVLIYAVIGFTMLGLYYFLAVSNRSPIAKSSPVGGKEVGLGGCLATLFYMFLIFGGLFMLSPLITFWFYILKYGTAALLIVGGIYFMFFKKSN